MRESSVSQNRPQTCGAYAKTCFDLKYGANRKPVPFTNSQLTWPIGANQVKAEYLDGLAGAIESKYATEKVKGRPYRPLHSPDVRDDRDS